MQKMFITLDDLPLLKNRGLAMWVDALEHRYTAMVARSFENAPAWLRVAPLRLDGSKLLGRDDLAGNILQRAVEQGSNAEKVLFVYGFAGSGKTTELTRLFYQPQVESRYGNNRIWVSGELGLSAHEWRRNLLNVLGISQDAPETSWQLIVSEILRSRPWFIALDNCSSPEFVQELKGFLPDMSVLVLTTRPGQAILMQYPEYARVQIDKLDAQDAWKVYLMSRKKPGHLAVIEKSWFAQMIQACHSNLLVLKLAFSLSESTTRHMDLLKMLQECAPENQPAYLLGKFLETNADSISTPASLLGALPPLAWADRLCFESLWDKDEQTTQGILSDLEQAGILTGLVDATGRLVGWRLHQSIHVFFVERLGDRREPEHGAWRERYRMRSGRSGWLYQTTKKLGPIHFWKNYQEQPLLLAAQEEKLGQPLTRGTTFWGLFPRAIQKMYWVLAILFSRNSDPTRIFSVQWQQLSLNSAVFNSERYISAYALERKFFHESLTNIYIGVALIVISPWLTILGLHRTFLADLPGLIVGMVLAAVTFILLLLFRLWPKAKELNSMDAIYNLLWEAPAATLQDRTD